jgi:glycosyltransferase involved in cell wall biosynthesis
MNICLVLISAGGWGGTDTLTYELAKHLRDKGENVSIILNQETFKNYADLEHVKLFDIGSLYPPKSIISLEGKTSRKHNILHRFLSSVHLYPLLRYLYYKSIRNDLIQFLSDNHIDVITPILEEAIPLVSDLVDDLKTLEIAGIPILTGEAELRGFLPVPLRGRLFLKWQARRFRKALEKMDKIIGVSTFILNAWEDQGVPLRGKSTVIPCGVDLSEIRGSLASTSKLEGEFNLLFPGGAKFIKGGDLLMKSLPRVKGEIPNIHVYVTLDVPQNHPFRKMVTELELEQNVTFVGLLPAQEYRKLLSSVDMLILPSRGDAAATVYVEAMALGKTIVAGNTGGSPEIVKNGRNGILVESNPDQIAKAILSLYKDEGLRREISQNNLQDVAKFDWGHIVDQYIEVYRQVSRGEASQ